MKWRREQSIPPDYREVLRDHTLAVLPQQAWTQWLFMLPSSFFCIYIHTMPKVECYCVNKTRINASCVKTNKQTNESISQYSSPFYRKELSVCTAQTRSEGVREQIHGSVHDENFEDNPNHCVRRWLKDR